MTDGTQGATREGAHQDESEREAQFDTDKREPVALGSDAPEEAAPRDDVALSPHLRLFAERAERKRKEREEAEAAAPKEEPAPRDEAGRFAKPEAEPEAQPEDEPTAAEPATDAPPKTIRLKVDGVERDVPLEDVISRAQKHMAGEDRLAEAARERKLVETLLEQARAGKPAEAPAEKEEAPDPVAKTRAALKKFNDAMLDGDEDAMTSAWLEVQEATAKPEPEQPAQPAAPQPTHRHIMADLEHESAWEAIRRPPEEGGYGDIVSDQIRLGVASQLLLQEMATDLVKSGAVTDAKAFFGNATPNDITGLFREARARGYAVRDYPTLYRTAGDAARKTFGLEAPQATSAEGQQTGQDGMKAREDRKRRSAAHQLKPAATRAGVEAPPPLTPEQSAKRGVKQILAARGQ